MALHRRKRNGKYTGNWIWRGPNGKEVNLGTKDKVTARERAALAEQGEWPRDAVKDARSAARNFAAADEGKPVAAPEDDAGPDLSAADVPAAPIGPGSVEGTPSTSEGPGVGGAATAADLNAAAGDAADAFGEMADAAGVTPEELKGALSDMVNDAPDLLAGFYLSVQALGVRFGYHLAKGKRTGTTILPHPIPSDAPQRKVLAVGIKAALARINLNIETIPWWAPLAVGIAWTIGTQVKSADVIPLAKPAATESAAQAPSPAVA